MRPHGRSFLVVGSADVRTPEADLLYAHALVRELTRALASEGARFVVSFGKEPRLESREAGTSARHRTWRKLPGRFRWRTQALSRSAQAAQSIFRRAGGRVRS